MMSCSNKHLSSAPGEDILSHRPLLCSLLSSNPCSSALAFCSSISVMGSGLVVSGNFIEVTIAMMAMKNAQSQIVCLPSDPAGNWEEYPKIRLIC